MIHHKLLLQLEDRVRELVLAALADVADRFTRDVLAAGDPIDGSDLKSIIKYWNDVSPALAEELAAIYGAIAEQTVIKFSSAAGHVAVAGRQQALQQAYLEAAQNRLADVGDALWREATVTLREGVQSGEGYDALRERLRETFSDSGKELGETRANRIARTEVQSAVNHGSLDAVQTVAPDDRPTYKIWVSTSDDRTREAHLDADGQTVLLDESFVVDGEELEYPGDPNGSLENILNCRCTTIFTNNAEDPTAEGSGFLSDESVLSTLDGEMEDMAAEMASVLADGSGDHSDTGMIALVPSETDAQRLAMDGGDLPEQLHVTLLFLGDTTAYQDDEQQVIGTLQSELDMISGQRGPIEAKAFGVSMFNPDGDEPCWVLDIGDAANDEECLLSEMHLAAISATGAAQFDLPSQHSPWRPHLTLTYSDDLALMADAIARVGPVTFDRLRLSVGPETWDFPFSGTTDASEGDAMPEEDLAADAITQPFITFNTARIRGVTLVDIAAFTQVRIQVDGPPDADGMQPWSGVIAIEEVPTGDGRIFKAGAFKWEADHIGSIRWDIEDDGEHAGAVVVGTILTLERRDGGEIFATGVFDTNIPDGAAAASGVERGTYGSVSVDMDDIPEESVEMDMAASVTADTGLSIAPDDTDWDEAGAVGRVAEFAGDDITVIARANLWIDDGADTQDPASYQLPFADVIDGELMAVVNGLLAAQANLANFDQTAQDEILPVINGYLDAEDASEEEDDLPEIIEASAWSQFKEISKLSAAAFKEPTPDELGTEDGPVQYANGRIFGWVARRGVCHDGYTGTCVKPPLDNVELSTFLRSKVALDDGTVVAAGVFTMGTGHDNDGADVASTKALFDDTRTVAGIVTCGVNDRGMWFSGVAAPWLSDWDRRVFASSAPSGHWRRERSGQWSLRAVLSVPVPGFPTRLVASAVERSNIAIMTEPPTLEEGFAEALQEAIPEVQLLASALVDEMERRATLRAEMAKLNAEVGEARAEIAASLLTA